MRIREEALWRKVNMRSLTNRLSRKTAAGGTAASGRPTCARRSHPP